MAESLDPDGFVLQTAKIAPLLIKNHHLSRIGIRELLSERMAGGSYVSHTECLMILLKNTIMEREPVYGIGKWASPFEPSLLGVSEEQFRPEEILEIYPL